MEYHAALPNVIIVDGEPCSGKTLVVADLHNRLQEINASSVVIKFPTNHVKNETWESTLDEMEHWLKVADGDRKTIYIFDAFIATFFTESITRLGIPPKHAFIRAKTINDEILRLGALHYILTLPIHMLERNYGRSNKKYAMPNFETQKELWKYNVGAFAGSIERTLITRSEIETFRNDVVDQVYVPRNTRVLKIGSKY